MRPSSDRICRIEWWVRHGVLRFLRLRRGSPGIRRGALAHSCLVIVMAVMGNRLADRGQLRWRMWSAAMAPTGQLIGNPHSGVRSPLIGSRPGHARNGHSLRDVPM